MGRAIGKVAPESRPWKRDAAKPMSAYEYYEHDNMTAKTASASARSRH
jgi:hypothetical protein